MRKEFRNRYTIIGILFVIVLGLLVVRLFNLQFIHGQESLERAQTFSRKDIRMTGPRGKILDSNGLPLAYNKTSYSVVFSRDPDLTSSDDIRKYTQAIIKTMKIIEGNGGKFLSTFAIHRMDDGTYDFSWPGVDKANDIKTYNARVKKWMDENCINSGDYPIKRTMTPEELFEACRKHYYIPDDATYEEAYKILSVWQGARAVWFASYIPIVLSQDVNYETVAEVKMSRNELPGVNVEQSSTRVYPNKSMAAHIIGYTGPMLDEPTMKAYEAMGYTSDDQVGITGIELTEESELTGNTSERTGTRVVEVDNMGGEVREISSDNKAAISGNNVMLTIDSNLQKRLEKALEENIAQIRAAQETHYQDPKYKQKYDDALKDRKEKQINYADSGGAVVMDVQTGDILAMASYPSFDLNLFTGGIAEADYKKLTESGTASPLFNNAVSSRGTPGSIFKMCTGLAGLMEDNVITLDSTISDGGEYPVSQNPNEHGPKCWVGDKSKHANLNIVNALKVSCNYFFFTVADRLGVDRLNKWADLLGLTSKTGVELPNEVAGQVGKQDTLYSSANMSGVAALVRNNIVKLIKDECVSLGLKYDDAKYTAVATEMMGLVNQNLSEKGPDIRAILKNELKLDSAEIVRSNLSGEISLELYQIEWNKSFTVEDGIGQSVTMLTPIAVARYVSAIVNGGNVFEARLVKEIITPDGKPRVNPPKLLRNLGAPEEYLNAIKEGMHDVVSDEEGTASGYFTDFEYLIDIGGKTGTAQVNKAIDLENNSWFVAFAPFDKPEIAVVVYIPHGYQGALSSYTIKQVIQYYMDKKKASPGETMPQVNMLVK